MIFDRTQEDITKALQIRAEKVQKGAVLTDEDKRILERGCLTYNTLNRIEGKQEELKNLLNEDCYFVEDIVTKTFGEYDFYYLADFERVLSNLKKLKTAYFVYDDTPQIPNNKYFKFEVINAVEKILYDIDVMISDIKSHYRECGNYVCGEES